MRHQNAREVRWLRDIYRLTDAEAEWLLRCGVGEGLLLSGGRRVRLRVEAPQALHRLFASDPDGGGAPAAAGTKAHESEPHG